MIHIKMSSTSHVGHFKWSHDMLSPTFQETNDNYILEKKNNYYLDLVF